MQESEMRFNRRLMRSIAAVVIGLAASRDFALAAANHPPSAGFGMALPFNGANQYIQIADTDDLDMTNNYTLECWFKADSFNWLRGLIGKYQTGGANGWFLRLNGTDLDFDQVTTSGLNLQTGRWYHVAAVNSNGTRTLYLNGVVQTLSGEPQTAQANGDPVCLGVDFLVENDRFFAGSLDEVRIWTQALSGTVVSNWMCRSADPTHPSWSKLVAYYRLDDGTGLTAADSAGAYSGTLHNMSGSEWAASTIGRQYAVIAGQSVSGQLPGSDEDGASGNGADWALTFEIVNPATVGTATVVSANAFTYSVPLVADTVDHFTYRVRDPSNAVSLVSTVTVSVASPRPIVDITNANDSVSAYTTTYSIGGTNNNWVVGTMSWTNAATGGTSAFTATSPWSIAGIALAVGDNTITVSGTNYAGVLASDSVTIARSREAGPGSPTHFVWTDSPTPTWPYTNWATAAHTIQDAVDTVSANDTVLVTNGVYAAGGAVTPGYSMLNRVCITKAITVRSVNGPATTFIVGTGPQGAGAVRCVFLVPDALVSGFTLTNGQTQTSGDWIYDESGGGAFLDHGGTVSNCLMTGCSADDSGGGAFCYSGGTLDHCILTGNSASSAGGGVYCDGGTLNNCTLTGNSANSGNGGGGVYCYNGTLNNCTLTGNSANSGNGGGVFCDSGGTLNNCTFSGNSAGYDGGGAYCYYGGTLNNCTVAGNSAGSDGGGVACVYGGTLNNCIVSFNTVSGSVNNLRGNDYTANHTCSLGLSGSGNIADDPQFVDKDAGDYRLRSCSPCVDAGDNGYAPGSTDLDGNPRIVNATVDMGAYESLRLLAVTNPPAGGVSVANTVSVYTVSGTNAPAIVGALTWTNKATGAGGGVAASGQWQVASIALTGGDNLILVQGTNAAGVSIRDSVLIRRAPEDAGHSPTHYVWANSPTPVWPYTNWATAAHTIQDAVDTASTNDTVLVTNGVYAAGGAVTPGHVLMNRVCMTRPITLCSVNGPSNTTIVGSGPQGAGAVRCLFLVPDAVVSGFTLNNGNTQTSGDYAYDQSGGGAFLDHGGTVSNCLLTGCSAYAVGGGAYCYAGGTLNNCAFSRNSAYYGGGAYCNYGGTFNHCTFSDNSANDGGGVYCSHAGTLNNCTLTGNSAPSHNGGGVCCDYGGTLNNCTLTGNSASYGGGVLCYQGGTLNNCTLSGNSASEWGGGAGVNCYQGGTLNNCIVFGNTPGGTQNIQGSDYTVQYTCSPGLSGSGNITNDPRFADAPAGNYRLSGGSPCINAGANAYASGATDRDGNPRIMAGTVDMGAYEYPPPEVTITNTLTSVPWNQDMIVIGGANNESVTGTMSYTNAATGVSGGFPAQSAWNSPAISLAYGANLITVAGTNSDGLVASDSITVTRGLPAVMYVSTNGASVWPYDTWANAATTIQAAVDAVASGGTVWVSNGVYAAGGSVTPGCALSNRVSLSKAVTLQSVNGAASTVIVGAAHPATTNGTSAMRCVWMNAGTLVGFTLTNGHTFATGGNWNHDLAGGGLNLSGSATASNCVIVGCSAAHGGGVKFVGAGTLEKSTVQNCRSDGQGGGLYFNIGGTASRCIVRNNRTSSDNGGGAYLFKGGLARSSLFVLNRAASSGGGALMDTGGTLENCTVVSNTCPNSGGGVYVWQRGTNLNTILQYNTATGATSNYTEGASGVFRYCCTTPLVAGTGNITSAPLFVGSGDYRLQTGSPCINTGTNQTWMSTATDLAGLPRVLDVYADMGAYEYVGAPVVDITTANANVANATTNTTLTGTANAWVVGTLVWTNPAAAVGGILPATSSWTLASVPLTFGPNAITVSGTNITGAAASDSVTITRDRNAGPGSPIHYVWTNSPAAAWPYTNWTTAAHTIQEAVETADANDTVLVTNGVYATGGAVTPGYRLTNRVLITRPMTVQSVNGAEDTFIVGTADAAINGPGAVRCVCLMADAVVRGFTLTNGHTDTAGDIYHDRSGGGAFFEGGSLLDACTLNGNGASYHGGGVFLNSGGVLTNCTLTSNEANNGYGGGAYVFSGGTLVGCLINSNAAYAGGGLYLHNGGTLERSTLNGNRADFIGGGAVCVGTAIANNCLMRGNSAQGGGGAYLEGGGHLNQCTLSGNTATDVGSGVYCNWGGTLTNCIVYGNVPGDTGNLEGGCTAAYCCSPGLSGSGNITAAPLFVGGGDYRLQAGSPCINAGNNAAAQGATDLDGNPRLIGGVVDMGSYECTSGSTANGIPWAWLLRYGLATDGSADHQHSDADTFDNGQEQIADTDPTNAASYFHITAFSNSPAATVSFVSSAGRAYTLIGVTNLSSGAWSPVPGAGPRLGAGGTDALSDTNVPPKGPFYRLKVELP